MMLDNPLLDKSAVTRFNNDRRDAQRATMPFNAAAQQSIKNSYSGSKKGSPVGLPQQAPNPIPAPSGQSGAPMGNLPTGEPMMEEIDPLDQIIGTIKVNEFIESAKVKDAATTVQLKSIFNATNPNKTPDSRNLLQQIANRIGLGNVGP